MSRYYSNVVRHQVHVQVIVNYENDDGSGVTTTSNAAVCCGVAEAALRARTPAVRALAVALAYNLSLRAKRVYEGDMGVEGGQTVLLAHQGVAKRLSEGLDAVNGDAALGDKEREMCRQAKANWDADLDVDAGVAFASQRSVESSSSGS